MGRKGRFGRCCSVVVLERSAAASWTHRDTALVEVAEDGSLADAEFGGDGARWADRSAGTAGPRFPPRPGRNRPTAAGTTPDATRKPATGPSSPTSTTPSNAAAPDTSGTGAPARRRAQPPDRAGPGWRRSVRRHRLGVGPERGPCLPPAQRLPSLTILSEMTRAGQDHETDDKMNENLQQAG